MSRDGHFTPESAVWRVGRESVLMLGGGRALLMQVAHPLVAAGVHDHSDFRREPVRRLARTMTALYTIVFGTREEAARVARGVRAAHGRVRGTTGGGTPYSAFDPDLQLWVHATLVDTGLAMYETFVRPLAPAEQEAFHEDMKTVARLFGVPGRVLPPTLDAFRAYVAGQVAALEVTPAAREVAAVVLDPPLPLALRPLGEVFRLATVGLLPERLRDAYGVALGRRDRLLLAASVRSARRALPLVPTPLRALAREDARGRRTGLPFALLAAFAGRRGEVGPPRRGATIGL